MRPKLSKQSIIPLSFLLLACTGCFSVKEEIYLNADGSGKYMMYTDMIEGSRQMMVSMMASMDPDADVDSLLQAMEDQLWQEYPNVVDSVIDFSDKVPDSIRNDPEKQKYLDRVEMFMEGSRAKGYMNSGMRFSFESMDDLENLMQLLDETSKNSAGSPSIPSTQVDYTFDKKSFSRTASFAAEDDALNDSTVMALGAILKESSWQLIVHLPKNVKKASSEQLLSVEGKDVIYQYDLIKIVTGERSMDMKIDF